MSDEGEALVQAQQRATVAREILRRMSETPGISDDRATTMASIVSAHATTAQAFAQIALVEMLQKLVVPPPAPPASPANEAVPVESIPLEAE